MINQIKCTHLKNEDVIVMKGHDIRFEIAMVILIITYMKLQKL